MDEEIERLVVSVRADTQAFARDVAEMRGALEGPFEAGVARAGHALEGALLKAVRTGKLGFEDLRRVALSVLDEIAGAALRAGIGAALGGGGTPGPGGLLAVLGGLLGAPGLATGGPVSPGRPYWVGERGPELFVPAASGRVEVPVAGVREVRVAITVNAARGESAQALAQSGRQVARAVKAVLERVD